MKPFILTCKILRSGQSETFDLSGNITNSFHLQIYQRKWVICLANDLQIESSKQIEHEHETEKLYNWESLQFLLFRQKISNDKMYIVRPCYHWKMWFESHTDRKWSHLNMKRIFYVCAYEVILSKRVLFIKTCGFFTSLSLHWQSWILFSDYSLW